ncbi:MAG TPA: class I SAM-dependent methyltransferase [Polyangiaceae bacterium]|nr:class I SAM-dependent methyltransferase [Polyangiaceae bacterium]
MERLYRRALGAIAQRIGILGGAEATILEADGAKYPVRRQAVRGFVESVEARGKGWCVRGWAHAPGAPSGPVALRVFNRGALVGTGVTQAPRPDVSLALGIDGAAPTTFEVHIAARDFDGNAGELHVFGVTQGLACELPHASTMSRPFGAVARAEDFDWTSDGRRLTLHGVRFATFHGRDDVVDVSAEWKPGENCVLLFKIRALVDEYLDWMAGLPAPSFARVVELGLYDGGSVPFWFELLNPRKHVGVEIRAAKKNDYLDAYVSEPRRRDRVHLAWGLGQDDPRLRDVVRAELGGEPIDFVVDDASHHYAPTRASFELLFPLVRPGGYYVVEDWAWYHWPGFEQIFANERPLTDLVQQLVEICGTRNGWIDHIHVGLGFVAVRRGPLPVRPDARFSLDDAVYRHPR